jgi:hypothetical protein
MGVASASRSLSPSFRRKHAAADVVAFDRLEEGTEIAVGDRVEAGESRHAERGLSASSGAFVGGLETFGEPQPTRDVCALV